MEEKVDKKNTILCVLSMHRSGSSMITRILNICGMYVGEENDLVGANNGNAKGHWEHREALRINEEILKIFNGSVVDIPNFPKNWQDDKRLEKLYDDARLFINEMNKRSHFWGFKDPRTCLTLPFWQKIIPNMIYIIPVRGMLDVANSLKKRDNFSLEYGMLLWIKYWRELLKNTYGYKRLFTFQKNYFVSWTEELEKMKKFLENEKFNFVNKEDEINDFISPKMLYKKVEVGNAAATCIDQDSFYPREIMDLMMSDWISFYGNSQERMKENQDEIKYPGADLNQKKQEIFQLNERVNLMQSSKFWKARDVYIYWKNRIKFVLFSPDKFLRKYLVRKRGKLIMTLLVRDEADIIEKNIKFHLAHGVDFIIATDNGSVDGTREILEKYQKKGFLHLINELSQDYSQAIWVNRMGMIAYEKYKADYIFHCDADEFWHSKTGNLKNEIGMRVSNDVLRVDLINVLLERNNGNESFPDDSRWAIINPYETQNLEEDSKIKNLYLFKYPRKVIYKTNKGHIEVTQGNHDVANKDGFNIFDSRDIVIYHYPLRSKKHFFEKIINGGKSYARNRKLGKNVGFHWRRWYNSYNEGNLDDEYGRLILASHEAEILEEKGIACKHNFKEFFQQL